MTNIINSDVLDELKVVVHEHDVQAVEYAKRDNIPMAHFALGCSVGAQEIIDVLDEMCCNNGGAVECTCQCGCNSDELEPKDDPEADAKEAIIDQIVKALDRANTELSNMTNGKYRMQLSVETSDE